MNKLKKTCLDYEFGEPSLLMIKSQKEQKFIEEMLNHISNVQLVWLGAKRDPK